MHCSKKIVFFLSIIITFLFVSPTHSAHQTSLPKDKTHTNILLVTIDTLRPDHIGCYGNKSVKTPTIDNLAKDGVLFTNAYTPVPLTLPSHVSIMTGMYPVQHGVQNNGVFISEDSIEGMAEILQKRGYKTGAVVASFVLASYFGLNQGFDYYNDYFSSDNDNTPNKSQFRLGEDVTDIAKSWLQENQQKPFFLWVHYFDPHVPYDPPAPFDSLYKNSAYDGEIAYTDQCLKGLFEEMRKLSLLKNTCIIVAGDHGEGLAEHEEHTHGLFIYGSTLRVPLIISHPGLFQKGKRVSALVSTADIMPTVLESLNLTSESTACGGKSLLPFLKGKEKDRALDLYCESRYTEFSLGWAPLEGIVTHEGWKYINAPRPELYNLKSDPHEKTNLFSKDPAKAESLRKQLAGLKASLQRTSMPQKDKDAKEMVISPEAREKLRSLGYIWCSASEDVGQEDEAGYALPDPKDKVHLFTKIEKAQDYESNGYLAMAIAQYEEVLKEDPENKLALYNVGMDYANIGEPEKALKKIQKVSKLDPLKIDCHNTMALIYSQLGMPEKAIQSYKRAIEINPGLAHLHNNLGMEYIGIGELDLAISELKQVNTLSQDPVLTSIALGNLGAIYLRKGKLEDALKGFKTSIGYNSLNRDAHIGLADTFYLLKNTDQSIHEWKKIIDLWPDDYSSYYKLAQLYLKTDKTEKAIQSLKTCLRLCPDYMDARILLQRI